MMDVQEVKRCLSELDVRGVCLEYKEIGQDGKQIDVYSGEQNGSKCDTRVYEDGFMSVVEESTYRVIFEGFARHFEANIADYIPW
jgi:hypothetical protein